MENLFKDALVYAIVLAILFGGYKGLEKFFEWKNSQKNDEDIKKVIKKNTFRSQVVSGCIQIGILLVVIIVYEMGQQFLSISLLIFLFAILYISFFKVQNVEVASPSSLFTGRLHIKPDEYGFSVPISKPYREGLHYKPFWWRIDRFSRKVKQLKLDKQEYQIGSGGTILVSGLVQYRISDIATYRAAEIGEEEVKSGLSSEVDQFIIKKLGVMDAEAKDIDSQGAVDIDTGLDEAIQTRAYLSDELEQRLKCKNLTVNEKQIRRILFGREVSYAEQGYGAEVLTARIDKVDPADSIRKERDRIQEERYQVRSERIQLQHFLNRVNETMESFEKKGNSISPEKAIEIVQLSMKLTSKDIKEFQLGGAEGLLQFVVDWLGNRRQKQVQQGGVQ